MKSIAPSLAILATAIFLWVAARGTRSPRETVILFSLIFGLYLLGAVWAYFRRQHGLAVFLAIVSFVAIPALVSYGYFVEMVTR
ncbi:hypothetical protein [Falsarthrobacter nasiphocae]|uniref:CHASE2 domain-containing sensor protein n=1 Tax=Falsarthrobacter nasiphocae TaxID=189863 RepID=A0AAE4C4T9_9MICC|nr:hypothetical protein [Falsarthrobacter nasiphocae]MDR6891696.1 CHASE2 domain-containing sensor protein [Falsarthrobacter nasiphocae]